MQRNKFHPVSGQFIKKVLFLPFQNIHKSHIIQIVPDTFHHCPNSCRVNLKMIISVIILIIKIHKLSGEPGAWICGNPEPFCHTVVRHGFQLCDFAYNFTGITIYLTSLRRKTDSSGKPLKKLHSQRILQSLYHLADTGLSGI